MSKENRENVKNCMPYFMSPITMTRRGGVINKKDVSYHHFMVHNLSYSYSIHINLVKTVMVCCMWPTFHNNFIYELLCASLHIQLLILVPLNEYENEKKKKNKELL